MKILVTGATGFVGSHTAVALQRAGHEVRVLVRNRDKLARIARHHDVRFDDVATGDITDRAAVADALRGCDGVVHAAAMVSTSRNGAEHVYSTNVEGTRNVIGQAASLGIRRMVYVSSAAALYDPQATRLTGSEPPSASDSPYGRSKAACEHYIRDLQAEGVPVSSSYPGAIIGPGDPGVSEPHESLLIFLKRTGILTSTGIQMVDVRDVAAGHRAMIEKSGSPQRITMGGHYYTWRALMDTLETLTGRRLIRLPLPGALLRALGRAGDLAIHAGVDFRVFNSESMGYATRWVCTDDSRYRQLLGLEFRDHVETMRDTLLGLHEAGHLTARQIGHLAEP